MEKSLIDYQNLKCDFCSNYLSFFPILITTNSKNFCGRCGPQKTKMTAQRNRIYESVAKSIKFPCSNDREGCIKKLLPSEVPEHEKNCNFREASCVKKYCLWKGSSSKVLIHCKKQHQELFIHENVEYKVTFQKRNREHFLVFQGNVFVIKWQYLRNINTLKCAIFPFYSTITKQVVPLQLTIKSDKISYCFDVKLSKYTSIDLKKLQEFPATPNCTVRLLFVKTGISWELIDNLKCSDCATYVLPPIYQLAGNSIFCPKCLRQKRTGNIEKNYSLTQFSNLLCYPCRNYSSGCTFGGKALQVEKHQMFCSFNIISCPLFDFGNCEWKGQKFGFYDHIESCHKVYVKSVNSFSVCIDDKNVLLGIIKFSKTYFRMVYMKREEKYYWSVEPIDVDDPKSFSFEIEIYEAGENRKKLVMRQPCGLMLDGASLSQSLDFYWNLSKEQILPLVKCSFMTFNVNVFQINS